MLPIGHRHALRLAEVPRLHSDPFHRLLIAQAQSEEVTLISNERMMKKYDVQVLEHRLVAGRRFETDQPEDPACD